MMEHTNNNRFEDKMLALLSKGPFTGTLADLAREIGCSRPWANVVQTILRRQGLVVYEDRRPRKGTWKIAK